MREKKFRERGLELSISTRQRTSPRSYRSTGHILRRFALLRDERKIEHELWRYSDSEKELAWNREREKTKTKRKLEEIRELTIESTRKSEKGLKENLGVSFSDIRRK